MVKLYPRNHSGNLKSVLWCAEFVDGKVIRRKQFSLYDVPLKNIEEILMKEFKAK